MQIKAELDDKIKIYHLYEILFWKLKNKPMI